MSIPTPPNEEARLAKLRAYNILDTPPERAFDCITRIAASVLDTPIALVSLVDGARQWFKSRVGLDVSETSRDLAFCAHAIMGSEVMVVADARRDPRFAGNPLVLGDPNIRFYAGAPLRTPDGYNLGTICAIDRVPRELSPTQTKLLSDLAALVIDELELRAAGALALREVAERTRAESTLRVRHQLLELVHAVAAAANEASEPGPVVQEALARVCALTGWPVGHAHLCAPSDPRTVLPRSFWYCAPFRELGDVRSSIEAMAGAPGGGLAERVLASGCPEIIPDLGRDPDFQQLTHGSILRAGIAVPVLVGSQVVAVLEFYADGPMPADQELVVQSLSDVAAHIARAIEREEVSRMKDEFVSTVSHELRTPLTSIKGSLGLIKSGVTGPVSRQTGTMLEIAFRNTDRLIRVVNDLLDIKKMEAGAMTFSLEPINLAQLIEQSMDATRDYCEQFGVTLRLAGTLPRATISGNRNRLAQVLTNLVSNAAKFSSPGGQVVVTASDRGGTIRLSVTDQGPGIPEEFKGRIFSRFAQADPSDSRQKGGTGLGLNICKTIVELHGGTIGFTTELGKGTTFSFDLPLTQSAECAATRSA